MWSLGVNVVVVPTPDAPIGYTTAADNIVVALVGNKVDCAAERKVMTREGDAFAKKANLIFMETSAKTNVNVSELFLAIGACACMWSADAAHGSHKPLCADCSWMNRCGRPASEIQKVFGSVPDARPATSVAQLAEEGDADSKSGCCK